MLIIFQVVNSLSQIILNNRYKFYKQPELEEESRFAYFPASAMVILDTESEFPNFLFWKNPNLKFIPSFAGTCFLLLADYKSLFWPHD